MKCYEHCRKTGLIGSVLESTLAKMGDDGWMLVSVVLIDRLYEVFFVRERTRSIDELLSSPNTTTPHHKNRRTPP